MTRTAWAKASVVAAASFTLGCGDAAQPPADANRTLSPLETAERFLGDRDFRREALVQSVVNPNNDYSRRRLEAYGIAHDQGWDALPEWNAPVSAVRVDSGSTVAQAVWTGVRPTTLTAWLELGRTAFDLWPTQINDRLATALGEEARVQFGLWTDAEGRVAGLVHVETADGLPHIAWTCSTCHAEPAENGDLVYGRAAASLDRGALDPRLPDGTEPVSWHWGPGSVDVTADGEDNPTAMPDLRATAHQGHLHWAATLKNSLPALMVRTETLLIAQAGERLRPPREIAVALALYVWSLGESGAPADAANHPTGAAIFNRECARCHHADGTTGPPVPITEIGTDPRVAESPARTTGSYRVPSLWAVGDRSQLLHDGAVPDVATLLEPSRLETVPGHAYGLNLGANERRDLAAFVNSIGRAAD